MIFADSKARFALMMLSSSLNTVEGPKLGANARGGNSLNVSANLKTSSIAPYTAPIWLRFQSQYVFDVMSAR